MKGKQAEGRKYTRQEGMPIKNTRRNFRRQKYNNSHPEALQAVLFSDFFLVLFFYFEDQNLNDVQCDLRRLQPYSTF
jgi:hypothetical protein